MFTGKLPKGKFGLLVYRHDLRPARSGCIAAPERVLQLGPAGSAEASGRSGSSAAAPARRRPPHLRNVRV